MIAYYLNSEVALATVLMLVLIAVSATLMHHLVGLRLQRLTIPSLFWYAYLVMVAIPSLFVFASHPHAPRYPYLGGTLSVLLIIPSGVFLANCLFRFRKEEIERFYQRPLLKTSTASLVVAILFFAGALLLTGAYFYEVREIPLLYALQNIGAASEFVILREESFKLLDSPLLYPYALLRQFGWAFIILMFFGAYLERKQFRYLLAFLVAMGIGLFYTSATLIRGPAAVIFLTLALFWYLFKRGRVNLPLLALFFALILLIPVLFYHFYSPERPLLDIVGGIANRLLYLPADIMYYYYDLSYNSLDFLYGRSIDKWASLLNLVSYKYEFVNLPNEVYRSIFPGSPFKSGMAPAPFLGDAYVNFGMTGVVFFSLLASWLMQSLQIWLYRQRKDGLLLAVHAILLYSFWELNRTAFTPVLISYGGLALPLLYYLYRLLEQVAARIGGRAPRWLGPQLNA